MAPATLIALPGGNVLSGDRFPDLDPARLEILKKILPSSGEAARPVDWFDTDRQTVFALKLQRPFGVQGALELEEVRWDASTQTLEGVSLGPEGTAHNVVVSVPQAQPWTQGGPFLDHDFDGYTLKMVDAHLLRVRVRFERGPRVA